MTNTNTEREEDERVLKEFEDWIIETGSSPTKLFETWQQLRSVTQERDELKRARNEFEGKWLAAKHANEEGLVALSELRAKVERYAKMGETGMENFLWWYHETEFKPNPTLAEVLEEFAPSEGKEDK